MPKKSNHTVHPRDDGKWGVRRDGNERDTSTHNTQREAIDDGRQRVANTGGGELTIQDRNGKIREKDTIKPGNDPNPPKG